MPLYYTYNVLYIDEAKLKIKKIYFLAPKLQLGSV